MSHPWHLATDWPLLPLIGVGVFIGMGSLRTYSEKGHRTQLRVAAISAVLLPIVLGVWLTLAVPQ